MPILSKSKTIKCPDGTTRNILKDPKEAFKTEFSTWDAKIKGIVTILDNNKGDLDAEVKKKTESIVQGLTETYATMQAQYCSAYLAYWSNPCDKQTETDWKDERKRILKKQTMLEKMEKQLKAQTTTKLPPITKGPTSGERPQMRIKKKAVSAATIRSLEKLYTEFSS